MAKTKNPSAVKRQGFDNSSDINTSSIIAARLQDQQEFHAAVWIARRANVALSTARLYAELFGIGGAN